MHGIKYFFLNKNNQTIQGGGKKNFQREQITEKHYFSKSKGTGGRWHISISFWYDTWAGMSLHQNFSGPQYPQQLIFLRDAAASTDL
jgi:hypothetical protein